MPQVSDERLRQVLSTYAGLVRHVLDDPERWLGWGADDGGDLSPVDRARGAVSDRLLGRVSPGFPGWSDLPPSQRADWWVSRLANVAGFVAATPRVAGAAADRLPLQAAFGASAQGLAVCAVAREYAVTDADDWVPLLATVLFKRGLDRGDVAEAVKEWSAEQAADAAHPLEQLDSRADDDIVAPSQHAPHAVRRAARTLVTLGKTFLAVNGMFDDRPRGALAFRALGKVPVVGLLGGWLDERGGVHKAARATEHAVQAGQAKQVAASQTKPGMISLRKGE